MGFSGGGSNVLLPHTHDGTVTQDGGPLNFNNITQSQSAAGEVFYSDGAHLQQLAYPGVPAGETLTAAAASTAPSWAAAASGAFTLIESRVNASSIDFSAIGGNLLSGFNFCKVIGSFVTAAAGDYFCLAFQNATAMITTYSSQGLFGTRSIPVSWLTSNSGAQNILAYTDGTPPSAVTFQLDFSVTSASGALAANNHFCHQTCSANGGNGNTSEYNTSVVTFPSTSDVCSFIAQAGPSGGIISPVSNSVQMSIFGY